MQSDPTAPNERNEIGLDLFGLEQIDPQKCLTRMDYDGSAREELLISNRIGRTIEQLFFSDAKNSAENQDTANVRIQKNSADN